VFDELWGPNTTNSDIFQKIGFNVIKTTMEGFHGVVFAYGQTSSGKTYSIHGNQDDPGMIPRAVQAIFEYINNTTDRDFLIQVSYMEIYNEVIHDLLNATGESLNVREDPKKGVYVHGLLSKTVMSTDQIIALLALGEDSRHVGKTDYNAVSSRSHTIFQIKVESQSTLASDKVVLESKLNLVDLAGSEDTTKAGLDKKAETGNINKSLLALASVIWKISEPKHKQGHIPYRDSKLTRLL
jgi:centromeric protein E